MTRSDLIKALALRFPQLTAKDSAMAVNEILNAIGQAIARGDRVAIRGFGSFGLNFRAARTWRNPKSGKVVQVLPKHFPHFKAGKRLRECSEQSAISSASITDSGQRK
jgi:integration host factor subunit beta